MFYVYRYTCPMKNEAIYIGKGGMYRGKPYRSTFHLTNRCTNTHLKNRIEWIRDNDQEPVIDFICKDVDEELAFLVEQEAIVKYGRRDKNTGTLCNWTDGGEGSSGFSLSEEHRRKISQQQVGKKLSEEHKAKTSASLKGIKRSDEYREKMRQAKLGSKWSEKRYAMLADKKGL